MSDETHKDPQDDLAPTAESTPQTGADNQPSTDSPNAEEAEASPADGAGQSDGEDNTEAKPERSAETAGENAAEVQAPAPMAPEDDRRKFPRQQTDLRITFTIENPDRHSANKEISGTVKDISNAGMQFVSPRKLWSGARLAFNIRKKSGHPVCTGRAVVVLAVPGDHEYRSHAKFMNIEMTKAA